MQFRLHKLVGAVLLLSYLVLLPAAPAAGAGGTTVVAGSGSSSTSSGVQVRTYRIFQDVDPGFWGEKDIVKMKLKGAVGGLPGDKYEPGASVTREQAVVMLVRVMGWEPQAAGKKFPSGFANPGAVSSWAQEPVALAVEKGIVSGRDLTAFRPAEPALRWEIAVFTGRALQLEAATASRAAVGYADAGEIPEEALGYVAALKDKGIMQGDDQNRFHPQAKVTRAEMAAILSRVDRLVGALKEREIRGTFQSLPAAGREIQLLLADGTLKSWPLSGRLWVYRQRNEVSITSLKLGEPVLLLTDGQGQVSFVEVLEATGLLPAPVPETTRNGTIVAVTHTGTGTITLAEGDRQYTWPLSAGAVIMLDGRLASMGDLVTGQTAKITVREDQAVRVEATSSIAEVQGILAGVDFGPPESLTLTTGTGEKSYQLAAGASIRRNGQSVSLRELMPGDEVRLKLRNNRIEELIATAVLQELEGRVVALQLAATSTITVAVDDGEEKTFPVGSGAEIRRDGQRIELREINRGDWVSLRVEGQVVTRIDVQPWLQKDYLVGRVKGINRQARVIVVDQVAGLTGHNAVYLESNSKIWRFGNTVEVYDVKEDDEVIVVGRVESGVFVAELVVVIGSRVE